MAAGGLRRRGFAEFRLETEKSLALFRGWFDTTIRADRTGYDRRVTNQESSCRHVRTHADVIKGGTVLAYSVQSKKSDKTYYLHSKDVTLNGGRVQTIYYFAGTARDNALDELPAGYEIMENSRTGLPMLRKSK